MKRKNVWNKLAVIILVSLLVFTAGCKKATNGNGNPMTRADLEESAASLSYWTNDAFREVYEAALDFPLTIKYSNGWWSFAVTLDTGEQLEVEIQFQDENKNSQKFYDAATTYFIKITGSYNGTLGAITFDMTASGVQASSNTVTVNGGGSVTYLDITGAYTINNMTVAKDLDSYPKSGTINIAYDQSTMIVTFNNSRYVTAAYNYEGVNYTVTIDLKTGEISD